MSKRRVACIWGVLFCLVLSCTALGIAFLRYRFKKELNEELTAAVGGILLSYPDVSEEALLSALRGESALTDGVTEKEAVRKASEVLEKYGYDGSFYVSRASARFANRMTLVAAAGVALFALCAAGLVILLRALEAKRLNTLTEDVRALNRHVYDLHIADNDEDAISLLRNEIYRTMVLLREMSEQAQEESGRLSVALADISHQIKTPLTGMQVMLDALYDDEAMPREVQKEFLKTLRLQTEQISSLVIALLQMARFDSGVVKLHAEETTAETLLREVTEDIAVYAELHEVGLSVSGDLEAAFICDARWEKEALKNIVKNGIEHSEKGSAVTLTVEETPLFVTVHIHDDGQGIAPEDLPHIFDRFYHKGTAGEESFGIGLSFARTVIEADGGFVQARSAKGKGTTFTVRYRK